MSKHNWKQHREYAESVTAHGSHRGDCPFCRGKNTFSASCEYGVLMYNCYKLGCNVGGKFDTDMTASEIRRHLRPAPEPADKEVETMEIPVYLVRPNQEHEKHRDFVLRWGLQHYPGLLYDVRQERTVFPILHKGRMIDAVGRAVGTRVQPKWYRYTGAADYFTVGTGDVAIVVEDVVSAIVAEKLVPNVTAMAILGTSISKAHLAALAEYPKVVIALDPDAMSKTISYRREINLWTGNETIAMKLYDDIKYRSPEDIAKLTEITSG